MGLMELLKPWRASSRPAIRADDLALYHFTTCPYCYFVRRTLRRLAVEVELRDVHGDGTHHQTLVYGGGLDQVPCLRIRQPDGTERWLYESRDIVAYLNSRFDQGTDGAAGPG